MCACKKKCIDLIPLGRPFSYSEYFLKIRRIFPVARIQNSRTIEREFILLKRVVDVPWVGYQPGSIGIATLDRIPEIDFEAIESYNRMMYSVS